MVQVTGRQRWVALGAAGVLLVLGIGLAVAGGDDDGEGDRRVAAADTSSTAPSSSTTTTTGAPPASTTSAPAATAAGGTRPAPTTTQVDREERCASAGGGPAQPYEGEWMGTWERRPEPNDPAVLRACIDDISPAVGQTLTVHLVADDPDAVITEQECGWFVDWEQEGNLCRDYLLGLTEPRPVPAEEPGHVDVRVTHAFTAPGTYPVTVSIASSEYKGYRSPYASDAEVTFTVTVRP